MIPSQDDLKSLPIFAPLFAAVAAPMSTLMDIPSLTEPWFFQHEAYGDSTKLPDPRANIVLSAVGLAFNVLANALLILRFSVREGRWRYTTRVSLICWVVKFGIALGNVLAYGILSRNTPDVGYGEGFWCAVMSLLIVTGIVVLLLSHYYLHIRGKREQRVPLETQMSLRIAGRHFMLQNTLFVTTIGLLALVMSRVEHWTYLQGIYFSVVTFLTVGFGDFYPTKTSTQIVLFPFALVGIVQLACLVDLLVRFFHGRLAARHAERRREFEKRRQEEENKLEKEPSLEREMEFLNKLYNEADRWRTVQDLAANITGFLAFWLVGAIIFSQIEGWTYGQGLYFCYVFFLTIGYGDFTPTLPASRVVFVVYSVVAVPVMASFAVQTIQNVFQKFSVDLLQRNEAKAGVRTGGTEDRALGATEKTANVVDEEKGLPKDVGDRIQKNDNAWRHKKTHADYIVAGHDRIDSWFSKHESEKRDEDLDKAAEEDAGEREVERKHDEDRILTEYVLELAIELEKHARRLLMGHLDEGSDARMLLKADRIVQLRNIRTLADQMHSDWDASGGADEAGGDGSSKSALKEGKGKGRLNTMMQKYYEEESDLLPFSIDLDDRETLEEIARYRETFAGLLAAGSRLLRLKDEEQFLFERRFWRGNETG
ncbi:voltage-gated potassium channel [Fomitiporia mediterranea MF3/22]|uniref:voltage-gated potassium channel n=1 Tax=Fomitiporia mediterranea (strain MF3/22) TaxID=694068 RepID=UPI0004408873|nr:voltage-gated potassium channel [Fomitiporia mediterranea MF3/22]EJD04357.1 voltage-gated potassium channel [Fomitiporia mediterranea MF3/22]